MTIAELFGSVRPLTPGTRRRGPGEAVAFDPGASQEDARRRVGRTRPARVLLVVENVPLARDHRLRKQVAALQSVGVDVSVICPADPANADVPGVSLYEYPPPREAGSKLGFAREYGYSWAMCGLRLMRAFARNRFDALQIAGNPDIYFTLALPFRWLGRPLVFDQRDLAPEVYRARYGDRQSLVLRTLLGLERASYHAADHVVVVNESLRRIATGRGRVPPEQVTIVGNGPQLAKAWRRAPRPELKAGRQHLAVWVGLMGPQDNVQGALQAIHRLVHVEGRTDCQFAFIGDGDVRSEMQRLAVELEVQDWVDFPGWADEERVFTYLSTADIGIEPNLEEVVSPVKVQEYMAFELPVVAFDLPETRFLAGPAAALAPPGDTAAFGSAIHRLLEEPAQRRSAMGAAGRRRVEESLAWDRQSEAYLGIWQELLAQPLHPAVTAGGVA